MMKPNLGNKLAPIEEILEFKCSTAIGVFRRKFKVSEDMATELWHDLIKWLWLGRFHQLDLNPEKPKSLFISNQLIAIDEMWHSFLLCTEEYSQFCEKYFGEFLHHVPDVENNDPVKKEEVQSNYEYVLRHLGSRVAVRWYISLPLQFEGTQENPSF